MLYVCVCFRKIWTWTERLWVWETLLQLPTNAERLLLPSLSSLRNGKPLITQALIFSTQLTCPLVPPALTPRHSCYCQAPTLIHVDISSFRLLPSSGGAEKQQNISVPVPGVDQSEWVSSQGSVSAAPHGAIHRPQLWEESLGKPQAVWTLFAHILHLEKSSIVTPPSLYGFFPRFQKSTWERWSLGYFCLFLPISPIIYPNSTSCERRQFIPISPILWVFQILQEIKVGVLFCFLIMTV